MRIDSAKVTERQTMALGLRPNRSRVGVREVGLPLRGKGLRGWRNEVNRHRCSTRAGSYCPWRYALALNTLTRLLNDAAFRLTSFERYWMDRASVGEGGGAGGGVAAGAAELAAGGEGGARAGGGRGGMCMHAPHSM